MESLLAVLLVIYVLFVGIGMAKAAITYDQHQSIQPFWASLFNPAYVIVSYVLIFIVLVGAGWTAAMYIREDLL